MLINPELSEALSFKPGVGQNRALCASPTAGSSVRVILEWIGFSTRDLMNWCHPDVNFAAG